MCMSFTMKCGLSIFVCLSCTFVLLTSNLWSVMITTSRTGNYSNSLMSGTWYVHVFQSLEDQLCFPKFEVRCFFNCYSFVAFYNKPYFYVYTQSVQMASSALPPFQPITRSSTTHSWPIVELTVMQPSSVSPSRPEPAVRPASAVSQDS